MSTVSRDPSAQDLDVMARTVAGEARSEPFEAQVAVAATIINRFNAGKWFSGKTLAETATKKFQYSCWNQADPNRAYIMRLPVTSLIYKTAMQAVKQALAGGWKEGVTHYYNPMVVPCPGWAYGRVASAICGSHVFFANVP